MGPDSVRDACNGGTKADVSPRRFVVRAVPELTFAADVKLKDFAWTHGKPAAFRSSSIAERDFCAACGTPLSYRAIGGDLIKLTTGSFDRPDLVVPTYATGTEAHLAWVGRIADLPGRSTLEVAGAEKLSRIVSHQHPDHD